MKEARHGDTEYINHEPEWFETYDDDGTPVLVCLAVCKTRATGDPPGIIHRHGDLLTTGGRPNRWCSFCAEVVEYTEACVQCSVLF